MSKKAIITGGARRLGRAMALELASQGTDIIIHYNTGVEDAEETRDLARQKGVRAEIIKADLLEMSDTIELIAKAKLLISGAFDTLINNASIFENDKLENFNSKSWEKHISTNLKAPALLTKEFSKNIKSKNNNIINIIDQRIFKLTPYFFSYTLSKTGLYTLTKTSAMSLSPNIRVNGIAPGPTIKNKRQSEKHFKSQYLATPLKQQVDVNEICNAVDFFIKNSSITGQVLAIDSGQSLNWQTPDIIKGKE